MKLGDRVTIIKEGRYHGLTGEIVGVKNDIVAVRLADMPIVLVNCPETEVILAQ
jgi:ribosomal protein L21E